MKNIQENFVERNYQIEYFESFLHKNSVVKIDTSRMDLCLLCGDQRQILKTPITGDSSIILRYREKEGAVVSMSTDKEELSVLQLQGAKNSISYKVATGIDWVGLFGNQVDLLAAHNPDYFRVISMPSLEKIEGLYETNSEMAINRYLCFANLLGLRFSKENEKYMKELSRL